MSEQKRGPREWTFDELTESQDFGHEDLFVKRADYELLLDQAKKAIAEMGNTAMEYMSDQSCSMFRKEAEKVLSDFDKFPASLQ